MEDHLTVFLGIVIVSECPVGMFRCNDGLCLDNKRRCDGRQHCKDGSDEINCRTVVIFLYLFFSLSFSLYLFACRSRPICTAGCSIDGESISWSTVDTGELMGILWINSSANSSHFNNKNRNLTTNRTAINLSIDSFFYVLDNKDETRRRFSVFIA